VKVTRSGIKFVTGKVQILPARYKNREELYSKPTGARSTLRSMVEKLTSITKIDEEPDRPEYTIRPPDCHQSPKVYQQFAPNVYHLEIQNYANYSINAFQSAFAGEWLERSAA